MAPRDRPLARGELIVVGALSAAALLLLFGLATERSGLFKDDTRHYGLMAEDPAYLARLPYTFRVLTPLLVHLLPLDTVGGFVVITVAGLWLCALVLYALLRTLPLPHWPSAAGVALFLGSGATTRALTTPLYVDVLTYLTELAAFLCLQLRRERLFVLVLVLGVLNRETALLLLPVYLLQLRAEGRWRRSELPALTATLLAPALALAGVVLVKLAAGGVLEHGFAALQPRPRTFYQNVPSWQDLADIFTVFGAGWFLAAVNLRSAPPLLKRGLVFGALVVLQLTVSRGDESRNLSHLLPLVLPLAALEFRRQGGLVGGVLLVACLASMVSFRWVVFPSASLRYALVGGGSLIAAVLALWSRSPWGGVVRPAGSLEGRARRGRV